MLRGLNRLALRAICLAILLGMIAVRGPVSLFGQEATEETAVDLTKLVGSRVDITFDNSPQLTDVEVSKVTPGKTPGAVKTMSVKIDKKRQQTVIVARVDEIFQDGKPLDVSFDKKARQLAHDPQKRAARLEYEERVNEALRSQREQLWENLTAAQNQEWIEKHKQFAQEVQEKMNIRLGLVETKYYLFYTDMPLQTVAPYIAYLDAMYAQLSEAFGLPPGRNIWAGKCPVFAFQNAPQFEFFERSIMNAQVANAQGVCHSQSDGRVVIAIHKGNTDTFFAAVLVHETAHGFIHRYKSTVHIPLWINEGIADWVAGAVVRADKETLRRQAEAADHLRQTGTLGGNFFAEDARYERWHYGVASSLVELMLRIDASKYRSFFDGIKEGLSSEESLMKNYGMSFADLTQRYGRAIGQPNLSP